MLIYTHTSFAGGSIHYDELVEKFPENKLLFDTLGHTLEFDGTAFAAIRLGSSVNEALAGLRLGPYTVCARQKYGEKLPVSVTINTSYYFLDKNSNKQNKINKNSANAKETITGIMINKADIDEF